MTCLIGLVGTHFRNGSHTISDKIMHDEVSKQIMIEKSSVNRTVVGTGITVNGEVEHKF
jgi:hypothetical protein